MELVDRVESIARDKGVSATQLALAWGLAQGDNIVPIPGTTRPAHLEQNAAVAEIVISVGEIASLEEIFPHEAAVGTRYTAAAMASVNA